MCTVLWYHYCFFFEGYGDHRDLHVLTHSSPTRRSSDLVEWPVVHHPPLRVARLGPGVGVEQIGEAERAVGNPPQHFQCVATMDADVAERRADRKSTRLNSSH